MLLIRSAITADRAAFCKFALFCCIPALGAANKSEQTAALGAAIGIAFYFGSAVIAKKTCGHIYTLLQILKMVHPAAFAEAGQEPPDAAAAGQAAQAGLVSPDSGFSAGFSVDLDGGFFVLSAFLSFT